jgi:hypothetical protein
MFASFMKVMADFNVVHEDVMMMTFPYTLGMRH